MNALDRAEALLWARVPELVDAWVEKCAAPAWDIRQAIASVFTRGDVGIYWNPETGTAGLHHRGSQEKLAQDLALVGTAVARVTGESPQLLGITPISNGPWVKVAYSPTLRRTGELLNFFPGEYVGGIPNAPSPLAATLSGGLVGAGLGYGVGAAGETLLPAKWQRGRLRKTLAVLGGLTGMAPGAMWALANHRAGYPINEPSLNDAADELVPRMDADDLMPKAAADLALAVPVPLGQRYAAAVGEFTKRAFLSGLDESPMGVDLNAMGQVLWESGADPRTAATTMGALYAAQQMPDQGAYPGYVTPHQTGLLGTMMAAAGGGAKGYATGWLVGKALGLLTGMPAGTQNVLKNSGAVLGVVDAVVPRLFSAVNVFPEE